MNRVEQFERQLLRVTAVADLASLIGTQAMDSSRLPDVVDDFVNDEGLAIHESAKPIHAALQACDPDASGDNLLDLNFTGVLLCVHTPVMHALGSAWSFSWGQCRYGYVYGATYETAVRHALEWAVSCYPEAHEPLPVPCCVDTEQLRTKSAAYAGLIATGDCSFTADQQRELVNLLQFGANLVPVEQEAQEEAAIDEADFEEHGALGTRVSFLIDNELLARVADVGGGDAFKDELHANTVLAHLLRLGQQQMEAQLNSEQEELF